MWFAFVNIFSLLLEFRPNDTRMLIALGDTYQNIEKQSNARKVFLSISYLINVKYSGNQRYETTSFFNHFFAL